MGPVGQVETDPHSERYIGAAKHTNNTGELTAMYYMIDRALRRRNRSSDGDPTLGLPVRDQHDDGEVDAVTQARIKS